MIIPWQEVDQETLNNLLESVVLREGTDYGSQELSFDTKVEQLKQRLKSGEAVIVFSHGTLWSPKTRKLGFSKLTVRL